MFSLIFALGAILAIVQIIRNASRSRRRTAIANGVVLRHAMRGWNPRVPCPDVEFIDKNGIRHEFQSGNGASWDEWPVGSRVEVSYDPNDPSNAELSSGETRGLMLVMLVMVGAVAAIIACIALISASDTYP